MTNEEKAQEFMGDVGNRIPYFYKTLNILANQCSYEDKDALDDLIQDVILTCYASIVRKGYVGSAYTAYFQESIRNAFFKLLKKQSREKSKLVTNLEAQHKEVDDYKPSARVEVVPEWMSLVVLPDQDEDKDERYDQALLRVAFDALPLKFQEVLNMRVDGLRYRQIYRTLNLTPSCLKLRLRTARIELLKKYNILKDGKGGQENG
ncbi:MAG: sigma-70 family RNA polymerase sigma factor [Hymenobacter sp.]|nr:MAG: sigma-70 family RNA polymerase sigma factor [Hymenobacter sp.]